MQERIENALDELDSSDFSQEDEQGKPDRAVAKPGQLRLQAPPKLKESGINFALAYGDGRELSKEDDESQRTLKREIKGGFVAEKQISGGAQPVKSNGTTAKHADGYKDAGRSMRTGGSAAIFSSAGDFPARRLSRPQFEEDFQHQKTYQSPDTALESVLNRKLTPSMENLRPRIHIPMRNPVGNSTTGRSLAGLSNEGSEARMLSRTDKSNGRMSRERLFNEDNLPGEHEYENRRGQYLNSRDAVYHGQSSHSQQFASNYTGHDHPDQERDRQGSFEVHSKGSQPGLRLSRKKPRDLGEDDFEYEKDDPHLAMRINRYGSQASRQAGDQKSSSLAEVDIKLTVDPDSRRLRNRPSEEESGKHPSESRKERKLLEQRGVGQTGEAVRKSSGRSGLGEDSPEQQRTQGTLLAAAEEEEEFQLFTEHDTGYSFCSFMSSREIHWTKKVITFVFLGLYMVCSVLSVLDLVKYSESECSLAVTTSVVYYLLCFVGIFLKFSGYVFIQMELLGRIDYTMKTPHLIPAMMALINPGLQVGYYSYDFRNCKKISLIWPEPEKSELLTMRLTITALTLILMAILSKKGLKTVQSVWVAALWMFFGLFIIFLAGISILMICTQKPGVSRGLLAETLLMLLLGLSGVMVLLFRCKKGANPLRLDNTDKDSSKPSPEEVQQPA